MHASNKQSELVVWVKCSHEKLKRIKTKQHIFVTFKVWTDWDYHPSVPTAAEGTVEEESFTQALTTEDH